MWCTDASLELDVLTVVRWVEFIRSDLVAFTYFCSTGDLPPRGHVFTIRIVLKLTHTLNARD